MSERWIRDAMLDTPDANYMKNVCSTFFETYKVDGGIIVVLKVSGLLEEDIRSCSLFCVEYDSSGED